MTGLAKSEYRKLTSEEHDALDAFAKENGPKWRSILSEVYWPSARIWIGPAPDMGYLLHAIRNEFGPTWLYKMYRPRSN